MATNEHFKMLGGMGMFQDRLFENTVGASDYTDKIFADEVADRTAELDDLGNPIKKYQFYQGQLEGFGVAIMGSTSKVYSEITITLN